MSQNQGVLTKFRIANKITDKEFLLRQLHILIIYIGNFLKLIKKNII